MQIEATITLGKGNWAYKWHRQGELSADCRFTLLSHQCGFLGFCGLVKEIQPQGSGFLGQEGRASRLLRKVW